MQMLFAAFTFVLSSLYVLLLDHITLSSRILQKVLVIPIIILLFVLYHTIKKSGKFFSSPKDKWTFLFGGTVFIQMLVLATGGLTSPFLILIHLFMIGISFLFSFSIALLFLGFSLVVLFIDLSFYHNIQTVLLEHPSSMLLLVSFIPIVPVAYLIARHYHDKDALFSLLKSKVATDEAIFRNLREMIIVTDREFHILSANDAAIRTLQQSRSELLDKPLFDVLLLRDSNGTLVTKDTFFTKDNAGKLPKKITEPFTLITAPSPEQKVTLAVHATTHAGENSSQISFIINYTQATENTSPALLDKARAKYEALNEHIKKKLMKQNGTSLAREMLLLEKIENDTYILPTLHDSLKKNSMTHSDIAKLCQQTVRQNQEFAKIFNVLTDFALHNFGMKDIEPLTVKNYPVKPEQLTGPFFTAFCNVKNVELAIQKVFDLAILLASTGTNPQVILSVERGKQETIVVQTTGDCEMLTKDEIKNLFVPYYGKLSDKTNLHNGSGLEGYIVKRITDALIIPLEASYKNDQIVFTLTLKKNMGK